MRKAMRLAVASAVIAGSLTGGPAWGQSVTVDVLSSFPELVTGGDALVQIAGVSTAPTVTVDGRDVSTSFVADGSGRSDSPTSARFVAPYGVR